jgi:hypothetical protein
MVKRMNLTIFISLKVKVLMDEKQLPYSRYYLKKYKHPSHLCLRLRLPTSNDLALTTVGSNSFKDF